MELGLLIKIININNYLGKFWIVIYNSMLFLNIF